MMRRFATLALIAVMLGAAPVAFAQGSGGGSGGSGSGGSSGSGAGGSGGGRSDGVGNTPGSPMPGSPGQNSPSQSSPGGSSTQTAPGASPGTPGPGTPGQARTTGPIDNSAQATTALQAHGYSNVQGLVRSGDVYRGRAVRDGRTVMIEMDARTGTVRETSG